LDLYFFVQVENASKDEITVRDEAFGIDISDANKALLFGRKCVFQLHGSLVTGVPRAPDMRDHVKAMCSSIISVVDKLFGCDYYENGRPVQANINMPLRSIVLCRTELEKAMPIFLRVPYNNSLEGLLQHVIRFLELMEHCLRLQLTESSCSSPHARAGSKIPHDRKPHVFLL